MMKKILSVCACILVALAVLLLATKNILAKAALCRVVAQATGLRLEVASVDVGITRSAIGARGVRLFNPPGFQDQLMCDMPEVYVGYDIGGFLKNKVHLPVLRLDIRQLTVETNQAGALNTAALTVRKPQGQGKAPELIIDRLDLKIGKVTYKGHSADGQPVTQEFVLHMDEHLEHVTNQATLVNLVLSRALRNVDISSLLNVDFGAVKKQAASKLIDTIFPKNRQ
ncbi:MAG TPA: hypothetical protein VMD52_07065 [Patescibacteria group bacterium]|nr:hypothetical protein [Patescibacteria group bacterium]